ncbi:MAG: hypothetical protein ABII23_02170 [bacterium]
MSFQHQQLAQGKWFKLSFLDQMANIGSEVERSLKWRSKGNDAYYQHSFERLLELLDLTLDDLRNKHRLRELARVREAIIDFFAGDNEFKSTEESWRKYFYYFTFAARRVS